MTQGGAREVQLPRLPGGPTRWLIGAGALILAVVAAASASGPVDVISAPPSGLAPSISFSFPSGTPPTPTDSQSYASGGPDLSGIPDLPAFVVTALQLLLAGLVLWAVYLLAHAVWRHTPRMRTRVVAARSLTALPALPDDLVESADARLALLQEGTPRNAIVACWVDLEDGAASAGLPRHAAETAAEYTVRVLHTWDVAPDAMGGLAELYREARYSRHPLTEDHRAEAIRRLTVIHDDLRRVVAEAAVQAEADEAARAAAFRRAFPRDPTTVGGSP